MTLSRVIMVLSLAVLAYILFNTVSNEDNESFQSEVEDMLIILKILKNWKKI